MLTAHIVVDDEYGVVRHSDIKATVAESLEEYGLAHATIEIELVEETCRDEPATRVRPAGSRRRTHWPLLDMTNPKIRTAYQIEIRAVRSARAREDWDVAQYHLERTHILGKRHRAPVGEHTGTSKKSAWGEETGAKSVVRWCV